MSGSAESECVRCVCVVHPGVLATKVRYIVHTTHTLLKSKVRYFGSNRWPFSVFGFGSNRLGSMFVWRKSRSVYV